MHKVKFFVIIVFTSLLTMILGGCQKSADPVNAIENNQDNSINTNVLKIGVRSFGILGLDCVKPYESSGDRISCYYNLGWRGLILNTNSTIWYHNNWIAAGSYTKKFACLYRKFAVDTNYAELINQINFAKLYTNWVYIDDGQTQAVRDTANECSGPILNATIDSIGKIVHSKGMYLAVAEDCHSVYNRANTGVLATNWAFYNNVDCIMPYGYNCTTDDLNCYFGYIRSRGKYLIPILGYHAKKDRYYYQTADNGFIQMALSYSNFIFYYVDQDQGYIDYAMSITYYLRNKGYIY